jgi:FAD/FMN-containing dehydrogenase
VKEAVVETSGGAAVAEAAVEELAKDFHGRLIGPSDAGYDAARRIWNASIDKKPGLIARCAGVADVVAAIGFARAQGLLVAVRGGGHNVGGRGVCDGGIVIDLSGMRGVFVDPEQRTVRAQGGATLGDVDRETSAHGLAVPLGVVSRTGVAGLTLGGGVGWLVRKHGLTCDNLLSCEVVTAEGEVLTAASDKNAELFWGLRGGGGNFGVVTSFLYRAHPLKTVSGGLIVHGRDKAGEVLRHYRDFMTTAADELTVYAAFVTTPDGMPAVAVIPCHCGSEAEAAAALKPLRTFGPPLMDAVQRMPFPAMQRLLDDAFPDGAHNYWKSTFVGELRDEVIDLLVEHASKARSPLSAVVVELYSGAADRVDRAETAFAQRRAGYDIGVMAQWTDAKESESHIAWARAMAAALEPHSNGRRLPNFVGEEDAATMRTVFGENYPRLAQIKKKYDPTNFFRINQNIQPAA